MATAHAKPKQPRRWSQQVTATSNALDLEAGVFKRRDPKSIARSLKRSAEHSKRRKAQPFQSAMSMLNFYVNRAGKNLSPTHKRVLERAKEALRELFGRSPSKKRGTTRARQHRPRGYSSQHP